MRQTVLYIFFLVSTTLLFSCKKYPEGGCERRSHKNIIGKWKLILYEVNGIDSTNLINYNGEETYKIISFYKDGSTIEFQNSNRGGAETVRFENGDKNLFFENMSITSGIKCTLFNGVNYCYRSYLIPEPSSGTTSASWTILKLKSNELVITLSKKNKYKIIFDKN